MLPLARRLVLVLAAALLAPLAVLIGAVLILTALVDRVRPGRRPAPADCAPTSGLASIVILNWNGRELLAEGLPSVLEAVRFDDRPHEVLVVDNGSTDGSVEWVRTTFPEVRVLALPENLGFAEGNNIGVRSARHDTVVLLNNDMIVDHGFLRPLLDGFGPETFAVASQVFLQDPDAVREETGKTTARFHRGRIEFGHVPLRDRTFGRPCYPTFWAGGGASAFHRARFLAMGGLDPLFSPVYVEDTDLSYRAWKVGWEVLFAPRSIVYHKHRASSNRRFKPLDLEALILRNQFFFLWKNVGDPGLLLQHALMLPWNCYVLARDRGLAILAGPARALASILQVMLARLRVPFHSVRSDRDIFELVAAPGLFFAARAERPVDGDGRPRVLWITAYLPHLGRHAGAGRMYQLLERLARRYRITLLTFLEEEAEREFLPEVESVCERVVAVRRIPPRRLTLFAYEPFEEFRTDAMERALRECLEEYDFDLVQLEYSQMACYADRRLRLPFLLTKHEVDFAACLRQSRTERNPAARLKWFYRYLQVLDREVALVRRVDAAICMTEPDAVELNKFCRAVPIHVVTTGVDLDYFTPVARPDSAPRLVFVGAYQHHPNVDAMLYFCREVLPRIRAEVPAVEMLVVGSNPPPVVLALGDAPGITVTGLVDDVRPFMASASVYVVPLRLGVGIRGKILEAWGMGMAVVATRVASAGLRAAPGENILLADDPARFAAATIALLGNPERSARLGAAGRRTAELHYSWDAAARSLRTLYDRYTSAVEAEMDETLTGAGEPA